MLSLQKYFKKIPLKLPDASQFNSKVPEIKTSQILWKNVGSKAVVDHRFYQVSCKTGAHRRILCQDLLQS